MLRQTNEERIVTFDLLPDNFTLEEKDLDENTLLDIADDIDSLLASVQVEEITKNDSEADEFQSQQPNVRFNTISDEQLDQLEQENEAKTTHWQTNWAVKILRGKLINILNG